jgi:hypothetical protein
MNEILGWFGLVLGVATLAGCGEPETSDAPIDDPFTIHITTPELLIKNGETFNCYYTDVITDRELAVAWAGARQGAGGHHVTVYYVDNERPVGVQPCSGTSEMVDWHFLVGAGGEGNTTDDLITLPEGLAVRVPAGKQLMLQSHYINFSGEERHERDEVDVHLVDPAEVEAYAADFVINEDRFELAPHSSLTASSICEIDQDIQLSMLLGHMHEQGVHFRLEEVDEQGETIEVLYEHEWEPEFASHPPVDNFTMQDPLRLEAGTRLRQTCSWNNSLAIPLLFPTEMCISFGYYFPATERYVCPMTDPELD